MQIAQPKLKISVQHRAQFALRQYPFSDDIQVGDQTWQILFLHGKPGRHGVPAVAHQQVRTFVQCPGDVKLRYAAAGSADKSIFLAGHNRWSIIGFRQPRSHQAHQAR